MLDVDIDIDVDIRCRHRYRFWRGPRLCFYPETDQRRCNFNIFVQNNFWALYTQPGCTWI